MNINISLHAQYLSQFKSTLRFKSKPRSKFKPKSKFGSLISVGIVSLLALNISYVNAGVKEKGRTIAEEAELRDRGWQDTSANLEMMLYNKKGQSSLRKLSIKTLEVEGDGDKSITTFNYPRDVQGTAFLSYSHALKPDQQWLFLPALKRVKRIASANKSGPFLGSELAYEDLASFEVEKYDYEYLKDEKLNGEDTYVVRFLPKYEYSGYKYQEVWIDQAEYRLLKVDYYDRKGAKLKTMLLNGYNQYLDKYWRADEYVINNHQTGKKTVLKWRDYQFRTALLDKDFDKNSLKRAR
ncbi:MAG: outer membrane lipoprotein-sorting protein [Alteromonadaceae bacterium]|nr:MAG: outer membrane lipoprotein-sorting protein [Alteromonadaceae bacterium]